jgi:hypothetical protein
MLVDVIWKYPFKLLKSLKILIFLLKLFPQFFELVMDTYGFKDPDPASPTSFTISNNFTINLTFKFLAFQFRVISIMSFQHICRRL